MSVQRIGRSRRHAGGIEVVDARIDRQVAERQPAGAGDRDVLARMCQTEAGQDLHDRFGPHCRSRIRLEQEVEPADDARRHTLAAQQLHARTHLLLGRERGRAQRPSAERIDAPPPEVGQLRLERRIHCEHMLIPQRAIDCRDNAHGQPLLS